MALKIKVQFQKQCEAVSLLPNLASAVFANLSRYVVIANFIYPVNFVVFFKQFYVLFRLPITVQYVLFAWNHLSTTFQVVFFCKFHSQILAVVLDEPVACFRKQSKSRGFAGNYLLPSVSLLPKRNCFFGVEL